MVALVLMMLIDCIIVMHMSSVQIMIKVQANYVGNLKRDVRLALAIDLFTRGIISIGRAAEIAGLPIQDFISELRRRGIHPFNYDNEELREKLNL